MSDTKERVREVWGDPTACAERADEGEWAVLLHEVGGAGMGDLAFTAATEEQAWCRALAAHAELTRVIGRPPRSVRGALPHAPSADGEDGDA